MTSPSSSLLLLPSKIGNGDDDDDDDGDGDGDSDGDGDGDSDDGDGDDNIIHLPINIENDHNVPGEQKHKRRNMNLFTLSDQGAAGDRAPMSQSLSLEMHEEGNCTKPLIGFAVSSGQLGYSLDGVTEEGEEKYFNNFKTKFQNFMIAYQKFHGENQ